MKIRTGFVSNSSSSSFIAVIDAEKAVDAIIYDLRGRKGFDDVWDNLDLDIRQEIRNEWIGLAETSTTQLEIDEGF